MDGPTFSCPICGKEYPWKPELAGKKGKCKCGAIMHVPSSATGMPARVANVKGPGGSKGGSSVMNTSSHVASRPRPTPKPVPMPGYEQSEDEVPQEPPTTTPEAEQKPVQEPEPTTPPQPPPPTWKRWLGLGRKKGK